MADVTARATHKTAARSGIGAYEIADGVTLYEGALVGLEGGYLNHWADGANDVFLGVLLGGDDRAGDGTLLGETSDTIPPEGRVDISGVTLRNLDSVGGSPAVTNRGDLVYGSSSNVDDLTIDATGRTHPIGYVSDFRSATDIDVTLFTPTEMLCQATA